ncbi:efflux RND transporter periplasmic adaptor subunit [Acerihabitans sp. KWT182]|uniref:Efflux RND transporter periplasmic adaptor subunit n=1 Tax=Acerihabitans sp. KWT182 TaxID=3157919 RepID=A0AAU7QFJ5_9GAMM
MSTNGPTAGKQGHKRRGKIIAAAVVVVLVIIVLYHHLNGKKRRTGLPPQVVSASAAKSGSMPQILNELGTVTPVATVTVLPQLSGYLTEVGYQEGQEVKKGQFLAQIDPRQYQIDKQQSQAQLAKDQASLDQARADLALYTQLHAQKSIAIQTFIDQKFTVAQDAAAVKADEASIAQYELDLAYCRITAPIDGRVGLRLVDVGNYVTDSSTTGIVVITSMKPTTVQFTVPQNALGDVLDKFNAGGKLPVTVYNSDNSKQLAVGSLYAIGNQMATSTGTVTLRATFPNDDEKLYPNEFVNVQLLVNTMENAVLVPTPAIQSGAPGNFVYLVNADNTVSVHKVTPGPSDGQNTAILSGLQAGQTVVTDGMDRLSDGARIKIAQPETAGGPQASSPSGKPHRGGKRGHGSSSNAQS